MADWACHVIPNPLDPQQWFPIAPDLAKTVLGLPNEGPLVLFGAMGGTNDPRKGSDLLVQALPHLAAQFADRSRIPRLVIFGQQRDADASNICLPVHYLGHLQDDVSLRLAYSAADVMVVPSRQEAFGQTASEAHACGTPVVAFNTGGLPDIVNDRVTGALAEPFDPASLAAAIQWVLGNEQRRAALGAAARERAERLWAPARVAGMYTEIYRLVLE